MSALGGKPTFHGILLAGEKLVMRSSFWKLICSGLLLSSANASAANETEFARIFSFLKASRFEGIRTKWDFAHASVQASKQAPAITIVYLTNSDWCAADGSGGCDFLILSKKGGRYRKIGDLNVTDPITLLGRAKDGYPIFGVMTGGRPSRGGTIPLVWAALKPKNGQYPENANDAPRLSSHARKGRVLISEAKAICNFRHVPPGRTCQRLLDQQWFPDRAPNVLAQSGRDRQR